MSLEVRGGALVEVAPGLEAPALDVIDAQGLDKLKRALAMGVDVVGGIPHFERTMAEGALSVKLLCELAAEQGKLVDMHCDESDDPLSR